MNKKSVRLLEKCGRYWKLPLQERGLIIRGVFLLSFTMLGLRTMSFRRCRELIEQVSHIGGVPRRFEESDELETRNKILNAMIAVEQNSPWRPNCLERSLALWCFFKLNNLGSELHIGGRKTNGRFEAHAWVEWDGEVLNDSPDVHHHYARFDAPIAATDSDATPANGVKTQ